MHSAVHREATGSGSSGRPMAAEPRVSVTFAEAISQGRDVHATYRVLSTEQDEAWENIVRWSDLMRMLAALDAKHGAELQAARASGNHIPTVRKHSLRTASLRLRESFCLARAAAMEELLQALVQALGVRLAEGVGPPPLLDFLCRGDDVRSPTAEQHWYTVDEGWPAHLLEGPASRMERLSAVATLAASKAAVAPRSLTPTRREAAALYPEPSSALGEVRVEVLEARGLIQADTFSQNDVYAVLVFEGHATATRTLEDMAHPRWQASDARAARFPIHSAYSPLFVALFDADFGVINADDPLGRVVLDLRTLHPNTVYDAWLPLRMKCLSDNPKYGEVRLRYSVQWYADQRRLLAYFTPPRPAEAVLRSRSDRARVHFAAFGVREDEHYDWKVLQGHLDELKSLAEGLAHIPSALMDLLYWRSPPLSVGCFLLWQLWCSFLDFTLSIVPLALLALLVQSYLLSRRKPPIHRPPSALQLWRSLLLGRLGRVAGLTLRPERTPPPPPPPAESLAEEAAAASPAARASAAAAVSSPPATPPASRLQRAASCGVPSARSAPTPRHAALSANSRRREAHDEDEASWHVAATELDARTRAALDAGAATAGAFARCGGSEVTSAVAATRLAVSHVARLGRKKTRPPLRAKVEEALAKRKSDVSAPVRSAEEEAEEEASKRLSASKGKWKRAVAVTSIATTAASTAASAATAASATAAGAAMDAMSAASNLSLNDLNPLAHYLGPVQRHLGRALIYVRFAYSVYQWEDPVLTGWLFGALLLLAALLVVVVDVMPWLLLLRLAGVLIFGPHMFFIGRVRRRKAYQEWALETRYQAASDSEARAIFDECYEAELEKIVKKEEKEAAAAAKKAAKRKPADVAREAERKELLRVAPFTESVPGVRTYEEKSPSLPLVDCSSATAMAPISSGTPPASNGQNGEAPSPPTRRALEML